MPEPKSQCVAWIDILGIGSLTHDSTAVARAEDILLKFQDLVFDEFRSDAADGVEIYGINDGFYVRGPSVQRICERVIAVFRRWFDERAESHENRPLLRGMVVHAPRDSVKSRAPIKHWLVGPGFSDAWSDERLLRGGRLFRHPDLRHAGLAASLEFEWGSLSQAEMSPKDRSRSLIELLWPVDGCADTFLRRLEKSKRLHDAAFESYLAADRKSPNLFMHYEETLKLHIRSAGKIIAGLTNQQSVENICARLRDFCVPRDHPEHTWGLVFAALSAFFLADRFDRDGFDGAYGFLATAHEKQTSRCPAKTWLEEFRRELREPTYSDFRRWMTKHDQRFVG